MFYISPLKYQVAELEPIISSKTLEFHYGKHLKGYIDNLNRLIKGTAFEESDIEAIIKQSDGAMFNNAAQVYNHTLYFDTLRHASASATKPEGALLDAICQQWGDFDSFLKEFSSRATTLFGSGWVWLSKDCNNKLSVSAESNAGNPLTKDLTPIMTLDVWEHAYYIDYQNRRADYVENFWKIIDWDVVSQRFNG